MFDHEWIEVYNFESIPLNRDIYLMEERWLPEYEAAIMAFLRGDSKELNVGVVAFAAARGLADATMQMSWYPNIHDRFHEVRIGLPRSAFVTAVGCWQIDEKPHVFVRDEWLQNLYGRSYSLFAMIDAIGVKAALFGERLTGEKLMALQAAIDVLSSAYPDMAFVSFADSLLIKTNWLPIPSTGSNLRYNPERILAVLRSVQDIYKQYLALDTYAVLAQGSNEYTELMHRSESGNHLSLNSLGLPFAQIVAIDLAARAAIKSGRHAAAEVYMDENLFHSLRLRYGFDKKSLPRASYIAPLAFGDAANSTYVMASRDSLIGEFDTDNVALEIAAKG